MGCTALKAKGVHHDIVVVDTFRKHVAVDPTASGGYQLKCTDSTRGRSGTSPSVDDHVVRGAARCDDKERVRPAPGTPKAQRKIAARARDASPKQRRTVGVTPPAKACYTAEDKEAPLPPQHEPSPIACTHPTLLSVPGDVGPQDSTDTLATTAGLSAETSGTPLAERKYPLLPSGTACSDGHVGNHVGSLLSDGAFINRAQSCPETCGMLDGASSATFSDMLKRLRSMRESRDARYEKLKRADAKSRHNREQLEAFRQWREDVENDTRIVQRMKEERAWDELLFVVRLSDKDAPVLNHAQSYRLQSQVAVRQTAAPRHVRRSSM